MIKVKIRRTDTLFSNFIRDKDQWICQRCKTPYDKHSTSDRQGLHCSHFYGRGREGTRFEPDNCISLCMACHLRWGHGDERDEYKAFMLRKLGESRFQSLMVQAYQYKKRDDKMDLIVIKALTDALLQRKS